MVKMATIAGFKKDVIASVDVPKFIEWNVDMNVSVPSPVRSKFLRRLSWILALLTVFFISLLFWQIKSEIEEMRYQVYGINQNYKSLQWRHSKLNLQMIDMLKRISRLEAKSCDCFERKSEKNNGLEQLRYSLKLETERNRVRRALHPVLSKHNETSAVARTESNVEIDELDNYRSARMKRDEGRGKKRAKKKRRGRLGPLTATFLGAVPEQHVIDSAHIGPWVKSIKNESKYSFNKFHLVDDRKAIEVTVDGLYMISAQIYYFGEFTHHSYWILLNAEGSSASQKVVKCAAVSALSDREVSCYTSVVLTLNRGDRIYLQQQERNRLINLREGYSYVQFVLLSTDLKRRF